MKQAVWTVICVVAGAGAAFAQDGDKRIEELKREFERSMKGLQEKFDQERSRLEKEFKAARERLLEKREAPEERKKPRGMEEMLSELLKRVEGLEKRLDKEVPRLRELPRVLPRQFEDFDFKRFQGGMPEEFKKWLEQMPKWKGGEDFKFEFRKEPPKKDKEKKDGDN